ncbi:MAG: histidine kinase [Bryobacterales bacterium]|nr:histidine kinase [Bryobacterales bacterium]
MTTLLELFSLTIFAFGAAAFLLLALSYWQRQPRRLTPFRLFTLVCTASFLTSLITSITVADTGLWPTLHAFATGLIPPLLLHVMAAEALSFHGRRLLLIAAYAAAVAIAAARAYQPTDALDSLATVFVAAIAAICLALGRGVYRTLFAALFLCSAAALATEHPLFTAAPDYLILLFFALHLYHAERLVFFDVFLKGGAYFATGLILLTAGHLLRNTLLPALSDWERIWFSVLLLMPAWLLAPLLHRILQNWIDRRILHRRYRPAEAEKLLAQRLNTVTTAAQLHAEASKLLTEIFDCPALAGDSPAPSPNPEDIDIAVVPDGFVRLHAGSRSVPFLSEDHLLLQSLAVILGNHRHALQLRQLRDEQRAREQQLETLTTQAELRALRAQINPHFLFNALNAVAACVRSRPDIADDTLMQLADVFRYTLRRSETEWVRLGDELHFIKAYLAVEQTRFHGRLQTVVEADPEALSLSIPAMLIQPLIENAIKHGTAQTSAQGSIHVTVSLAGPCLWITVSDNGPGFADLPGSPLHRGYGLRNVAERLRLHYGANGSLSWQNEPQWTTVRIHLPAQAQPPCAS